ncbi:MAG: pyridoxamine 5'-phosphate oxidase family protein [Candidatus Rokubacteria bacterium]|nr:pyridoxamine 5'-phosphate oxidase family protein [Candidatus Rokubacteria bacterium]MBI3824942.1 pyridoxamine 5'-phosphate oxidase family protein [Candidatus Rokubacteria bacterium]
MRLADPQIQAFLATKDVVVLATVRPDGGPLAMPMWFVHDAEAVTMLSVNGLAKIANMQRDPRVCVVAEAGTRGDVRGVTVVGRAAFLADSPERRALVERFHAKYDPHLVRLWNGRAMPANRVMFRITPDRVGAWGLG